MAVRYSISEIINKAIELPTKKEKIEWLQQNQSMPLKTVLKYWYDESVEFLVPSSAPPWKKNEYEDEAKSLLYTEARRLRIFIKGGGYDNLNQVKREQLFISLLEDVDNDDAEMLCKMISKKSAKGLSRATVATAFPDLIETKQG